MSEEVLADDGYPSDEELERIKTWDVLNEPVMHLFGYVHARWRYADAGFWTQDGCTYYVSTAGWSGNEDIICALRQNELFWMMCWVQSRRGGHYIFEVPKALRNVEAAAQHPRQEGDEG